MHEKFREAWKAAGYVASGLNGDFPGRSVEVAYHCRGAIQKVVCPVREVGRVIEQFCRKFPMATVYYHGVTDYGCAAEVRCHCGREKSRGCCKDGGFHRAKVLVTLEPVVEAAVAPGQVASGPEGV